ncbi:TRAP transporter large permease subunit [Dankookia rubra]|uniref:TRAP transporter large permease subunit n=1 Tax=Dankookia rubra TaxID=1442381 RepID=A0A4R5QJM0_9PROT|nr:TRAP transporter large permease subunit [Dankookia rubra]TDH62837.1 TRAP transporter large permease subunit [Dankookia rubra]
MLVWFGIPVLASVEAGMIPPRFGMNRFVVNAMARHAPMRETCRGVAGFVVPDVPRVAPLTLLPWLSLWLPGLW